MTGIGCPLVEEEQRPLESVPVVPLCCSCAGVESVVLPCASTTPPSGPLVPILFTASATPLATNRVRAVVATSNIARLIIYPSSFFRTRPLVRMWAPHVGGENAYRPHNPFLPL